METDEIELILLGINALFLLLILTTKGCCQHPYDDHELKSIVADIRSNIKLMNKQTYYPVNDAMNPYTSHF